MTVSYKKLWHILIDRNMKKKDLETLAGVNHYTLNRLSRGENVPIDILGKICTALGCKVDDIVDFLPQNENED